MRNRKNTGSDQGLSAQWILIFVLLIGFLLRLHNLGSQSFWFDEIATYVRTILSFDEFVEELFGTRNHVPVYFLLMRGWALLGDSELVFRYFSLIWGVIAIAIIFRLGSYLAGWRVGLIAAYLLAISPFHIWYSQEARMYTLTPVLILCAHWFFVRGLRSNKIGDWIGYAAFMLVALYTHYLTLLIFAAHYTYFAIHYRSLKPLFFRWLGLAVIVGLLFGLWGAYILVLGGFSSSPIDWIAAANWNEPILTLLAMSVGPTIDPGQVYLYLIPAIFVLSSGLFFVMVSRKQNITGNEDVRPFSFWSSRLLLFWLIVPVLITFLISFDWSIPRQRSIYVDRYLIIVLPALLVAVSWGLVILGDLLKKRWVIPLVLGAVTVISINPIRNNYSDPLYSRPDWRTAFKILQERATPEDVILGKEVDLLPVYYYNGEDNKFVNLPDGGAGSGNEHNQKMAEIVKNEAQAASQIWLLTHYFNNDPHGFPQIRNRQLAEAELVSPHKIWMDKNLREIGEWKVTGILLSLYELPESIEAGEG